MEAETEMSEAETVSDQERLRLAEDRIAELRGEETPTERAKRELMEEEKRRELEELAATGRARFLELLASADKTRVGVAIDAERSVAEAAWQRVRAAVSGQRSAARELAALVEKFGGTMPHDWEVAKGDWVSRQPRLGQPTTTEIWRRDKFLKAMAVLFGRL